MPKGDVNSVGLILVSEIKVHLTEWNSECSNNDNINTAEKELHVLNIPTYAVYWRKVHLLKL